MFLWIKDLKTCSSNHIGGISVNYSFYMDTDKKLVLETQSNMELKNEKNYISILINIRCEACRVKHPRKTTNPTNLHIAYWTLQFLLKTCLVGVSVVFLFPSLFSVTTKWVLKTFCYFKSHCDDGWDWNVNQFFIRVHKQPQNLLRNADICDFYWETTVCLFTHMCLQESLDQTCLVNMLMSHSNKLKQQMWRLWTVFMSMSEATSTKKSEK